MLLFAISSYRQEEEVEVLLTPVNQYLHDIKKHDKTYLVFENSLSEDVVDNGKLLF